jgi:hypothetical protein
MLIIDTRRAPDINEWLPEDQSFEANRILKITRGQENRDISHFTKNEVIVSSPLYAIRTSRTPSTL